MSCVTAHLSPPASEQAVLDFMKSHSANAGEVMRFLQRSDFEVKGGNFYRGDVSTSSSSFNSEDFGLVFLTDDTNYSCLGFSLLNLIPFNERTWVSLRLAPKQGESSAEAIVVSVDGR